jgi:hypothetical protein
VWDSYDRFGAFARPERCKMRSGPVVVHPMGQVEGRRDEQEGNAMASQDPQVENAGVEAFARYLDEHFGDCYLPDYIAEALAAGIGALRAAGSQDLAERAAEFLESAVPSLGDTGQLAEKLAELDSPAEVASTLSRAIAEASYEEGRIEKVISDVLGDYEVIGGWSGRDPMWGMSETTETCLISRNGRVATFDRSEAEGWDTYWLSEVDDEHSDPGFRRLRLDIASKCVRLLGPGVWIDDDIDAELREMTLPSDEWDTWWHDNVLLGDLDDLVEEYSEEFASAAGLPEDEARIRLAALLRAGTSTVEPERAVLWKIWKDRRV